VVRRSIRPEKCAVDGTLLDLYYLVALPDVRKVLKKKKNKLETFGYMKYIVVFNTATR